MEDAHNFGSINITQDADNFWSKHYHAQLRVNSHKKKDALQVSVNKDAYHATAKCRKKESPAGYRVHESVYLTHKSRQLMFHE